MSFLSYKVVRGTCLRFPEQLEVVVAGDVLQQRLPARSVALTVILAAGVEREKTFTMQYGDGCGGREEREGRILFSPTYHVLFLLILI